MAGLPIKIMDPHTGEVREVDGPEGEEAYRTNKAVLPRGVDVPLSDANGNFQGYFPPENVAEAIRGGTLRFANKQEVLRDTVKDQGGQAFLEAFAENVGLPGMYDLPAKALGADMELLNARRELPQADLGTAAGFGTGVFLPLLGEMKVIGGAAKIADKLLLNAAMEAAQRGVSEAAEKSLTGLISHEGARRALSQAAGHATVGTGIGAMATLDEAALGNTEASVENILGGIGAGALIGGGLGAGLSRITAPSKVDGRKMVGGAAEQLPDQLDAKQLAAALEAQGFEVDQAGMEKWFPRLMARLSSGATGVNEADVMKVMSPAGQKVVLQGERARSEAAAAMGTLIDELEANSGKFDLEAARMSPSILNSIPQGVGDTAIKTVAADLSLAKENLTSIIRNASNYGKTPEQMTNILRPIFDRLRMAERTIVDEVNAAGIVPPAAGKKAPRPSARRNRAQMESGKMEEESASFFTPQKRTPEAEARDLTENSADPVFVSTDHINLEDLDKGFLHGVEGASKTPGINDMFPGRFTIQTVPQGRTVKYNRPTEAMIMDGMAQLRRTAVSEHDLNGEHAFDKIFSDLYTEMPTELNPIIETFGNPKIRTTHINNSQELADDVLEFIEERIPMLPPEQRAAAARAFDKWADRDKLREHVRKSVAQTIGNFEDEQEVVLMHSGGLKTPRERTVIYDRAQRTPGGHMLGKRYTVDEFKKAVEAGEFAEPKHFDRKTAEQKMKDRVPNVFRGESPDVATVKTMVLDTALKAVGTNQNIPVGQLVASIKQANPGVSRSRILQAVKQLQVDNRIQVGHLDPKRFGHMEKIPEDQVEKFVDDFVVSVHDTVQLPISRPAARASKDLEVKSLVSPLEQIAGSSVPVSDKVSKAIYRELDQVYRVIAGQSKKVKPILGESQTLEDVANVLKSSLQRDDVWGGAASSHRKLTEAADKADRAALAFREHFPADANGKVSRDRLIQFTKQLDRVQGEGRIQALQDWVDAQSGLADATTETFADIGHGVRGSDLVGKFGEMYKRMRKDVLTLNAQDRLLSANRAHGIIPGMALGAGLASLGLGPAGYMAGAAVGNAILNPGRSARTIAAMGAFRNKIAEAIDGKIKNLIEGARAPASRLPYKTPAAVIRMTDGSPEERAEAYREHVREMAAVSEPTAYVQHISSQLADIAEAMPNHASGITAKGQQIQAHLESIRPPVQAPHPKTAGNIMKLVEESQQAKPKFPVPPSAEIRKYGQSLNIAVGGTPAFLEAMERGLTAQEIATYRALYPNQDAQLRQKLLESMPKAKNLKPAVKRSLQAYFEAAGTDPELRQLRQGIFQAEAAGAAQSANPVAGPSNGGTQINILTSPTDRLQNFPTQ